MPELTTLLFMRTNQLKTTQMNEQAKRSMDTQWFMSQPSGTGAFCPMLQHEWTLKTLPHEDTESREESSHENLLLVQFMERKTWKTSQDGRTCSPQGDRYAAKQQWDPISHLSDCRNPGLLMPADRSEAIRSVTCHGWCVKKQLPIESLENNLATSGRCGESHTSVSASPSRAIP